MLKRRELWVIEDRSASAILVGLFSQEKTEETEKTSHAIFPQFTPFPPVNNSSIVHRGKNNDLTRATS
jgi:hypothetical protein